MQRFFLASLLFMGVLTTSCAPRTQTVAGVTYAPVLIKVSEAAARGSTVTIQGRYLGGPTTGKIILGATVDGKGGYVVPGTGATSWTDSQIVLTIPADAPVGGSWLFVEVNGMRSATGLPYSVKQ